MSLLTNLRAYWKLDESSGNATDSSGNGFTLTNTTSKAYVAALINNGIDFGSSVRNTTELTTSSQILSSATGSASISLWFKQNTSVQTAGDPGLFILPYKNATGSVIAIILKWNGGSPRIEIIRRTSSDATAFTTFGNSTSVWYHVVAVYNGSTISGYLDNVAFSTTGVSSTGTFNAASYPISLGGSFMSNNATAIIDEVGVWDKALTTNEISQLYNGGAGLSYPFPTASPVSPSGGVAYSGGLTMY